MCIVHSNKSDPQCQHERFKYSGQISFSSNPRLGDCFIIKNN